MDLCKVATSTTVGTQYELNKWQCMLELVMPSIARAYILLGCLYSYSIVFLIANCSYNSRLSSLDFLIMPIS